MRERRAESPDRPPERGPGLAGRTVLVTGGARRVGEAISRRLAAGGARVLVHHHRSGEAARALAAELPGAQAFAADLTAPDGPSRLLAACAEAGAFPDAIVHSAASFLRRPVADTSAEDWDAVFALNLRSFFLLARDFARRQGVAGEAVDPGGEPHGAPPAETADRAAEEPGPDPAGEGAAARKDPSTGKDPAERSGAGGSADAPGADRCLIAISDSGAFELWTGYAAHCVAKAALHPLVRVLAKALAPAVRVNAVVPGPVLPEPGASPERRQAMADRTLLGRLGEPDDVARAVCFLLENRFTTGTVLEVTGGAHLWRGRLSRD